jgi:hypothetical protein
MDQVYDREMFGAHDEILSRSMPGQVPTMTASSRASKNMLVMEIRTEGTHVDEWRETVVAANRSDANESFVKLVLTVSAAEASVCEGAECLVAAPLAVRR